MATAQGSDKRRVIRVSGALLIFALVVVQTTYFSVSEGFAVVVTRFGRPTRELTEAGPYWRLPPPIEELHEIDCRQQVLQTPATATLTRDKKSVVLTTYVIWRVEHPLRFLQSVGTTANGESHLAGMVTSAKNQAISRYDLAALASTNAEQVRMNEIEKAIAEQVQSSAITRLGVTVIRVGFERITLPPENYAAVLERMRAEREAEAARVRGEGAKAAQAIRDESHIKSQEILRKGREAASQIAADSERDAAETLARSHAIDPQFFQYWLALRAAKQSLGDQATIVLRGDRLFFDALLPNQPAPSPALPPAGGSLPAQRAGTTPAERDRP